MATGTTDYEDLTNKPSIDGVELTGDIVGGDTINTSFNNISDTLNNTFVSVQQYVDDSLGDQFIVEFVETV